jgi:hypothetical protein
VVDLWQIVRVGKIVLAEFDSSLPGVDIDEQGALDVEKNSPWGCPVCRRCGL